MNGVCGVLDKVLLLWHIMLFGLFWGIVAVLIVLGYRNLSLYKEIEIYKKPW